MPRLASAVITPLAPVALVALLASGALLGCGGGDLYAGMPAHVKQRHVALDGAHNFRDLGGYATADGRHVKWGLLYRSDGLSELSDDDLAKLRGLDIELLCDFRSSAEKAEQPDRLPVTDPPAVLPLEIGAESFLASDLRERIASGNLEGLDLRAMMIEGNRQFATTYAPQYAAMFERITNAENLPALVHCTAGKDRTGFASALILTALGVPRETVMEDFLLSNHYTAAAAEQRLWMIELFSLFRADTDALRPLFGVEPAYLEAAFDAIEAHHGDFDSYRRNALGLDDAELETFRSLALE
ncbi:MAG TPA: tyrosine-protein phosphatase [Myxococcota bacterium]|nr:tyrosine-protein phosphatase [Myxococcota bacterium]